MRVLGVFGAAMAVATLVASSGLAQDLPGRRDALDATYPPDAAVESVVLPHASLSEGEITLLANAVTQGLMPDMVYYGAIAIAPDAGLANPQTTVAVGNFHDTDAAAGAAVAACNEARAGAGRPCVAVMLVRPAGWQEGQGLQLSAGAAEALRGEYRRAPQPRMMAISPATGRFGIGGGEETALAACGFEDCRIAIVGR